MEDHRDLRDISINQEDFSQPVEEIRIVAHTTGPIDEEGHSENHFSQYLVMPSGRTVQINMWNPDLEFINGTFKVKSCKYLTSNTMVKEFKFKPVQELSMKKVVTTLLDLRFNNFAFADGGMGCRYWNATALMLYERYGWVDANSSVKLLPGLPFFYSKKVDPDPIEVLPGTFELKDTRNLVNQLWSDVREKPSTRHEQHEAQLHELRNLTANFKTNPQNTALHKQRLQRPGGLLEHQDNISVVEADIGDKLRSTWDILEMTKSIHDATIKLCAARTLEE